MKCTNLVSRFYLVYYMFNCILFNKLKINCIINMINQKWACFNKSFECE